jgi:polar amino acid transport system permease protein
MPRSLYHGSASAWLRFLLLLAGCGFVLWRGGERLGYNWHWRTMASYFWVRGSDGLYPGPLVQGLIVTLEITLLSLILCAGIGLLVALLRLSPSRLGRWLARLYLESVRNTPLLVQIFFAYFVMAPILGLSRFTTGVLALSLFEGAYASEIIRSGITSVDMGQWEAGRALGLRTGVIYRKIILPQALSRVLAPLTSQAVSLLKDSALVSTIAVYELTMQGRTIIAETFLTFEVWFTVAALYLVMALLLSLVADYIDRALALPST